MKEKSGIFYFIFLISISCNFLTQKLQVPHSFTLTALHEQELRHHKVVRLFMICKINVQKAISPSSSNNVINKCYLK